jgi:adenylate cyclase
MTVIRRLAAILAADVAGYSRLMGADEEGTLTRLKAHRRHVIDPKIREHNGRIVKTTGDGLLVEFPSVVDAVRCAVEVQSAMLDCNAKIPDDERIAFRVGINLGDVIVEASDIYGDGVNIAARLEALAEPGGICVSRVVRDQIRDKLPYPFEDMGEQSVKNIARAVHAYAMSADAIASIPINVCSEEHAPTRRPVGLRRAAVAAAALVAMIGIVSMAWWTWSQQNLPAVTLPKTNSQFSAPSASGSAPRLSFVVLPFENLSRDPDQDYFADGITDDLTTDLSRISGSFVIARNTAFTYKDKPTDARQIGRELGVRYVIEGSVRRAADQVQVNVQLVNAETGAHLWADRFDTDRLNLAEAQSEITGRLAQTLHLELLEVTARRIEQEKEVNPDARDLIMQGWAWYYRPFSAVHWAEAERSFEQALKIDPRADDARIGLATVLAVRAANGLSSSAQQDQARAEQLALEALDRDPNRSMAHYAIGFLRFGQLRSAEAQLEFRKSIALDPNNAFAFNMLGQSLRYFGEPEAAIPYTEKAIKLSPLDPNIGVFYLGLGVSHLLLGHVNEAVEWLLKARQANPRLYHIHLELAGALGLKGDLDGARAAIAEAIKLKPEVTSLARWRAVQPLIANPAGWALREKTVNVGLRRAGFPDE